MTGLARFLIMDQRELWKVIEDARRAAGGPDGESDGGSQAGPDAEAVAAQAVTILAALPAERIVRAAQPLWDLMSDAYLDGLWAAAYLINAGASDDGFDYFRGWLIAQGREAFERAVADPDSLADLPAVRAAAAEDEELECQDLPSIVWDAYRRATGEELPEGSFTIRHPPIDADWNFDDADQMRSHLPRLARLYLD